MACLMVQGSLSQGLRGGEQVQLETNETTYIHETTLVEYGWKMGG